MARQDYFETFCENIPETLIGDKIDKGYNCL